MKPSENIFSSSHNIKYLPSFSVKIETHVFCYFLNTGSSFNGNCPRKLLRKFLGADTRYWGSPQPFKLARTSKVVNVVLLIKVEKLCLEVV